MNDLISSAIELKRHRAEEQDVAEQPRVPMEVDAQVPKEIPNHRSPDNVSDSLQLETAEDDKTKEAKEPEQQGEIETESQSAMKQDDSSADRVTPNSNTGSPVPKEYKEPERLRLSLADLEDFFTVAPHVHPHLGSATYRLRNGLARAVEEQEILAEQLMRQRYAEPDDETEQPAGFTLSDGPEVSSQSPTVPAHSVPNSQAVTRSGTPLSIYRKGAPSLLPNIPRIEISATQPGGEPGPSSIHAPQAMPLSPNTPRTPAIGEGGILLSRSKRSTVVSNPTEAFRAKMEACGILKSVDRPAGAHGGVANAQSVSAGQSVSGDGFDVAERQLHVHHWNYVDPAVIFKDILG